MERKQISAPLLFLIFLLVLTLVSGSFCWIAAKAAKQTKKAQGAGQRTSFTIVIDAGHGGEDGGTVSASGIVEKELNLQIALLLRDLLEANGVKVIMTRTTDTLLYDKNADYEGRKKVLDLAARREIAEKTENAVFVSIHMNAYPQTQYKGLQVWYSKNCETSYFLAKNLQSTAKLHLQPDNNREVKGATSAIHLLHRLTCPAVLVECGFLSNPEEAARLCSEEYQRQLAFVLFLGIVEWMESA